MIKLCVFDMGGVIIRDFSIGPELLPYLGYPGLKGFQDLGRNYYELIEKHSIGEISEDEFWREFEKLSGKTIEEKGLLGKFFHPVLDAKTIDVIKKIKDRGMRVVCATNVIDSHYKIHMALHQYDIFDKVYPSHFIHLRKPDLRFYRYVAEQEGVNPSQCFFTDDIKGNVDAGKEVGMSSFQYIDAEKLERDLKEVGVL